MEELTRGKVSSFIIIHKVLVCVVFYVNLLLQSHGAAYCRAFGLKERK